MIDVESHTRQLTINDYANFEQLYYGLKKSVKGVRWKDSVAGYESNGLKNTFLLRQSLLNGEYKIDKYQKFYISEPKRREIIATRIKDRQFQHAICDNGFIRMITRSFIYDNCACQNGKGILFAHERMEYHLHKYYREHGNFGYVLKCDIKHFFKSINHNVAKSAVNKRVDDEGLSMFVYDVIDSFGSCGLGLGSQISQYIALAVLDDLDHYIKEELRIKHYIRYMDDFILIHDSKEYLKICKRKIEDELKLIELELNDKTAIFPLSQGVNFLKWKFCLTESGKVIKLMSKSNLKRERRHLKNLINKEFDGVFDESKTNECFNAWVAYASYGNTETIIKNMKKYMEATRMNAETQRLAKCEAICNLLRSEMEDVLWSTYNKAVNDLNEDIAETAARKIRNLKLVNSDNRCTFDRILPEIPTEDTFEAWLPWMKSLASHKDNPWGAYRQHLRDIPNQVGFPFDIDWGDEPVNE